MTLIWAVILLLTIAVIYLGHKLEQIGKRQLGIVLILIGMFQILGMLIAIL